MIHAPVALLDSQTVLLMQIKAVVNALLVIVWSDLL